MTTGEQFDDKAPRRAQIRTSNPPGGKSSGLWWAQQELMVHGATHKIYIGKLFYCRFVKILIQLLREGNFFGVSVVFRTWNHLSTRHHRIHLRKRKGVPSINSPNFVKSSSIWYNQCIFSQVFKVFKFILCLSVLVIKPKWTLYKCS